MKARVKEMEAEAAKLREMQAVVSVLRLDLSAVLFESAGQEQEQRPPQDREAS